MIWKTSDNTYYSQNQITDIKYQSGNTDGRKYKYAYDYAGRLLNTSINYIPEDLPEDYLIFNSYTYNENSQTGTFKFDPINLTHTYSYDSRSRITNYTCSNPNLFSYSLTYYSNSNINTQTFTGQYRNSFSNQDNLSTEYTYDKSNRLTNANFTHTSDNTFDLANSYDYDGNILTLQRYGSSNNLVDNFSYSYYTGTNKLNRVSGSTDQYTYDYNGNQTNDYLNNNTSIKYDHRNLNTEFTRQDLTQEPPITDVTRYKYDEAGNRVRKTVYRNNSSNPDPLPEEEEDIPPGWSIIVDDYYSRDATGREIAIYSSYTIQYWNVWSGNEITGRINFTENEARFYYLKDHLGSIRVVLDNSKNVVSANDFDAWGYYLENRTYSTTNTKNKFTGKERDTESSYDYFGARYYDARVGRWLSTDPLFEKHIQFTPYNYVLDNPLILIDPDGRQIDASSNTVTKELLNKINDDLLLMSGYGIGKNENNILTITQDLGNKGKSSQAREIAEKLFKDFKLSAKLIFDYQKNSHYDMNNNIIYLNPNQIEAFVEGTSNLNISTNGFGMVFIHEALHGLLNVGDIVSNKWDTGPIVDIENIIRNDMGNDWGKRLTYKGFTIGEDSKLAYIPFISTDLRRIKSGQNPIFQYIKFNTKYNEE